MFCLFHCLANFLQSIKETGFHRWQRERKNFGHIGKAVVAIDSETNDLGLFFWDFHKKLGNALVVRFIAFRWEFSHVKASVQRNHF